MTNENIHSAKIVTFENNGTTNKVLIDQTVIDISWESYPYSSLGSHCLIRIFYKDLENGTCNKGVSEHIKTIDEGAEPWVQCEQIFNLLVKTWNECLDLR